MTLSQTRALLAKAFKRWNEDNAPRLSAAFAFYAILAVAPLLIFMLAVGSQILDKGAMRESILHEARTQLGSGAGDLVTTMIDQAAKRGASTAAGVISILLALFGASGLFDQLTVSVNSIWRMAPKSGNAIKNFVAAKLLSVVMALIFLTLIFVWIGIDSAVNYLRHHTDREFPLWHLISFVISVAFLTGVFAIVFKGLPKGMVAWRDVWFPAFITAFGFGVAKYILSIYFGFSNIGLVYGPAGALVVILLWMYYSSQIFFFGVELTFAYAYAHGSHRKEIAGELKMS